MFNSKRCLICRRDHNTLHWHANEDGGNIWVYCVGKCQRGYSLRDYISQSGVDLSDFLKGDFQFEKPQPNEVNKMEWTPSFIPLSDPRASLGLEYLKKRGLDPKGDIYFDLDKEGIVFPYYYHNYYCGAQIRLIEPWINPEGNSVKILTVPGTRLGLLFGLWNQGPFITKIKSVVVCEGYLNALSLQQTSDAIYGGHIKNPWKFVCSSGAGISSHQVEKLKELKDAGIMIVSALDSDEAGLKGLKKLTDNGAITHFSITQDTEIDWNDILKINGKQELFKLFLQNIHKI